MLLTSTLMVEALERPKLRILNPGPNFIEIFLLAPDGQRVANGKVGPGKDRVIGTSLGHRFAIVDGERETVVRSMVPAQGYLLTRAFGGARTLSIRRGSWKYLDYPGSGGTRDDTGVLAPHALPEADPDSPAELYDLAADPGETTNLFSQEPGLAREH